MMNEKGRKRTNAHNLTMSKKITTILFNIHFRFELLFVCYFLSFENKEWNIHVLDEVGKQTKEETKQKKKIIKYIKEVELKCARSLVEWTENVRLTLRC